MQLIIKGTSLHDQVLTLFRHTEKFPEAEIPQGWHQLGLDSQDTQSEFWALQQVMDGSCAPVVRADRESNSQVLTERETLYVKELARTTAGKSTGKGQKEPEPGGAKQLQGAWRKKGEGHWGYRVSSSQSLGEAGASFQGQQRSLMA